MKITNDFIKEDDGAVTVDWVVLTSSVILIGFAVIAQISNGVRELSGGINGRLESSASDLRGPSASFVLGAVDFFKLGIEEHPGNQRDAWLAARLEVDAVAPDGYEFDPNLTTTRYVDNETVYPIYVSDDGLTYSIGGEIVLAADYDHSGSSSFKSAFDGYWNETH